MPGGQLAFTRPALPCTVPAVSSVVRIYTLRMPREEPWEERIDECTSVVS